MTPRRKQEELHTRHFHRLYQPITLDDVTVDMCFVEDADTALQHSLYKLKEMIG